MSVQCEFCLESFKNKTLLKQHQARTVYCKKYRGIRFSCDCCGFSTKGIKMIERHDQECPGIRTETNTVETETIKPDTTEIDTLKRNLELEKLKNKIYHQIIIQNTGIKLEDVMVENDDNIILNLNKNISVVIQEYSESRSITTEIKEEVKEEIKEEVKEEIKEEVKEEIKEEIKEEDTKKDEPKTQRRYRTIKGIFETTESNGECHEELIYKVDERNKEDLDTFMSLEESQVIFDDLFGKLKIDKNYTKVLSSLSKNKK